MKLNILVLTALIVLCFTRCEREKPENNTNEIKFLSGDPCKQLDEIDKKMLDMIEQIKEEYKGDKGFILAFNDAQVYWIQYRNRQVKAMFPKSPRKYKYDVGECKCKAYRDLTVIRVKELQKWLDGVSPSETCTGSYKIK